MSDVDPAASRRSGQEGEPQTVLIAHPSADVYGADLQMLETVSGLGQRGWRVVVTMPAGGPLVERLLDRGAEVELVDFPVLRKEFASPVGLLRLGRAAVLGLPRMLRLIGRIGPDVVYVNTVTLPWWLAAARLRRLPVVCHLHEAERETSRLVRAVLISPLWLASTIIVISRAAMESMAAGSPRLVRRAELIYNGVPQPPEPPELAERAGPVKLITVGRLSPRKAPHDALEATALLRREGRDVVLEVAGTAYEGYEWYEEQLRERADRDDLRGTVTFSGYCSPIWPALSRSDFLIAPSGQEPFGNAVVEAQYALRPVVAAAAQGHLESIADEETGLLVTPGDPAAIADAVRTLIDEPRRSAEIAENAGETAIRRFSTERYSADIAAVLGRLVPSGAQ